jgi:hypothetical protein
MKMCDHIGTSHGELRSSGEPNKLFAVIVCGNCDYVVRTVDALDYEPNPVNDG